MAGTPARGYKWADFTKGHEVTLRHGVHSPRKVDPVAAELVTGLISDRPDLERFPEVVMAWARAEARCLLADEWMVDHPPHTDEGQRLQSWVHRVETQAQKLRERLGLDPKAEAELARERADAHHATFDLEVIRARGREALEARGPDVPGLGLLSPPSALESPEPPEAA